MPRARSQAHCRGTARQRCVTGHLACSRDVVVGAVQRVPGVRDGLALPVQVRQDAHAQLLRKRRTTFLKALAQMQHAPCTLPSLADGWPMVGCMGTSAVPSIVPVHGALEGPASAANWRCRTHLRGHPCFCTEFAMDDNGRQDTAHWPPAAAGPLPMRSPVCSSERSAERGVRRSAIPDRKDTAAIPQGRPDLSVRAAQTCGIAPRSPAAAGAPV